jgi:serine/threonine protein kinase
MVLILNTKPRNFPPFVPLHTLSPFRYRAPEIGLCRGYYSHTIDVWSLGCVFAELLHCMQPGFIVARRVLFPGDMCRSEMKEYKSPVHPKELLAKFHAVLGPPSQEDVDEFAHVAGKAVYAKTSRNASEAACESAQSQAVSEITQLLTTGLSKLVSMSSIPFDFTTKYSQAYADCPSALSLLVAMLAYSPSKRISSSQALCHDFINPAHADVTIDSLVGDDGHERAKRTAVKLEQLNFEGLCHHRTVLDPLKIAELLRTEVELHKAECASGAARRL